MAKVVRLKAGHPLIGTWQDADRDYGTTVQFTIRPVANGFDVQAVDTMDGERLSVSRVQWNGRTLRFSTVTPATGHEVDYQIEVVSPNEIAIMYSVRERWIRVTTECS